MKVDLMQDYANDTLRLNFLARDSRPTEYALNLLRARYPKGVRFRIESYDAHLYGGARTMFQPVIEVASQIHGKFAWIPYQWMESEL